VQTITVVLPHRVDGRGDEHRKAVGEQRHHMVRANDVLIGRVVQTERVEEVEGGGTERVEEVEGGGPWSSTSLA